LSKDFDENKLSFWSKKAKFGIEWLTVSAACFSVKKSGVKSGVL
jgi:hypothetical protein